MTTSHELVPVGEQAPAPRASSVVAVEQASQTLVGVLLLVSDAIGAVVRSAIEPPGSAPRNPDEVTATTAIRRITVGMALDGQRRALELAEAGGRLVGPTVGWLVASPFLRPVTSAVGRRVDAAYERGREQEERSRELASRAAESGVSLAVPVVLDNVDIGPIITGVLDQVDLKPVIDKVIGELDLPVLVEQVMGELDLDPIVQRVLADLDLPTLVSDVMGELQMSSVVLQATGGITEDVLGEVRNRTADGDALVERIVAKVLRRRVSELPPPAFGTATTPPQREQSP